MSFRKPWLINLRVLESESYNRITVGPKVFKEIQNFFLLPRESLNQTMSWKYKNKEFH